MIPFYIALSYLISLVSNISHDDQQAHWNFIRISKHTELLPLQNSNTSYIQAVKQSDEETAMTLVPDVPMGHVGLVREHTVPASVTAHQPAHSLPSLLASRCTLVLRAGRFSPECSKLSVSHPA